MTDIFIKEFKDYYLIDPFAKKLQKMSEPELNKYCRKAQKIANNSVFKEQIEDIIRDFTVKLCYEENPDNRATYKGALLFAKMFKKRIDMLALGDPDNKELNDILNNLIPE